MADFPYGLVTPPVPGAAGAASSTRGSSAASRFFGRGIIAPFRRGAADIVNAEGIRVIKANMAEILGTRADSDYTTGELPWRTEFGSLLHFLQHRQNNPALAELARIYVVEALARWEPRVIVRDVLLTREVGPDANRNEKPILLGRVVFDVRSIGSSSSILSRGQTFDFSS